jgi:hypothetical protein
MKQMNASRTAQSGTKRYVRNGLLAAAGGLALIVAAAQPATAEDADMAALRAENRALAAQLERLEGELKSLKQAVVHNAEAVAEASQASAPKSAVLSSREDVDVELYGKVNRIVMGADDGNESRWFHADNDYSSTRIGLKGGAMLDAAWRAGATIEVQFESNSSTDVTINQNGSTIGSNSFTERKLELWFENADLGTIALGQGETASDGITGTDLSGTGAIQGLGVDTLGSSLVFANSDGTSSGVAIGDVVNDFAGLGRDDRIGYYSPDFNGFQLAASHVDGDAYDVALRYGGEFGGVAVEGAAGYADSSSTADEDVYGVSLGLGFSSGTSLSAGWGGADRATANGTDPHMVYVKLGQDFDWVSQGATSFGIDWYEGSDIGQTGDTANSYSAAVVQQFDSLGAEVYGTWRRFSLDRTNSNLQDIDVVAAGATLNF